MNNQKNTLVLIAAVLLSLTVVAQETPSLAKMTWLVGSWKGMASNQPFYEAWRKTSATQLTQYGIKISSTDTVISEIGKIAIKENNATYGDDQHTWMLDDLSQTQMVFVNPQIRFPNTITWRKMPNGHWYCLLSSNDQKIEYDIVALPALDTAVDKWIKANKKS